MSKPIIALIILGVILFIAAMVLGVDALMCDTTVCLNVNGQRKEYDALAMDGLNSLSANLFLRFSIRTCMVWIK